MLRTLVSVTVDKMLALGLASDRLGRAVAALRGPGYCLDITDFCRLFEDLPVPMMVFVGGWPPSQLATDVQHRV